MNADRWLYVLTGLAIGLCAGVILLIAGMFLGWWMPPCGVHPWQIGYA